MEIITTPPINHSYPQGRLCDMIDLSDMQGNPVGQEKIKELLARHKKYVCGDLHGNFKKLLDILIHFEAIHYRGDSGLANRWLIHFAQFFYLDNPIERLQDFLKKDPATFGFGLPALLFSSIRERTHIYERVPKFRDLLRNKGVQNCFKDGESFKETFFILLNDLFSINYEFLLAKKEFIFVGDTCVDRGPSDFLTLIIFQWMTIHGIKYHAKLGNHELTLFFERVFLPKEKLAPKGAHFFLDPQFRSFDLFRLPATYHKTFKDALFDHLGKCRLIDMFINEKILNKNGTVILTHAPYKWWKDPNPDKSEPLARLLDYYDYYLKNHFRVPTRLLSPVPNLTQFNDHMMYHIQLQILGLVRLPINIQTTLRNFCFNRDYKPNPPVVIASIPLPSVLTTLLHPVPIVNVHGHQGNTSEERIPGQELLHYNLDSLAGQQSNALRKHLYYIEQYQDYSALERALFSEKIPLFYSYNAQPRNPALDHRVKYAFLEEG